MATIKSFTNLEQCRKLATILPPESADMCYIATADDDKGDYLYTAEYKSEFIFREDDEDCISCWSLAALLGVLPEGIIENYYAPNLQKENSKYSIAYGNGELLCIADNPVDACVEMIEKLKENDLL